ncbi:MAG: 7-carboxy-7-deazaguanine synthase QueE [Planctomycetota bacterium]|jgi:7-carboxy-7-deazaguanine synthase
MHVSEIFYSLQGEGRLVGVPSIFIRLAGCPLRCRWCDTKYAWDEAAGNEHSIDKILHTLEQWACEFVVVTGGEPMTNSELPELVRRLKTSGKHVTIETAGIAYIADMPCDLMSISPKLSNSTPAEAKPATLHEDSRLDVAVLAELVANYTYQLKFVVDSEEDLGEIQKTVGQLPQVDRRNIMLMPQGKTRDEVLARSAMVSQMCKHTGFVFCQRLQCVLWDNARQT